MEEVDKEISVKFHCGLESMPSLEHYLFAGQLKDLLQHQSFIDSSGLKLFARQGVCREPTASSNSRQPGTPMPVELWMPGYSQVDVECNHRPHSKAEMELCQEHKYVLTVKRECIFLIAPPDKAFQDSQMTEMIWHKTIQNIYIKDIARSLDGS
jgi:hypothetical protein